ncbi:MULTISPECIES: glycosyltransferase [unclassified Nocardia]|uniref:glycosyltransferase n=1 Tax=unclassified Nocardia TaxID=2637762 RepID=UPI001CE3DCBA|nr:MULTISPECIES: glycosyltransferase [unclassified Nocardia]
MRVAMVSEQASPLTASSGQHRHVAALSGALAGRGHEVTVFTRREDPRVPDEVDSADGYRVVHVPAGPPRHLPEDKRLPFLGEFGSHLRRHWSHRPPDVAHAHFWLSGLVTELAARDLKVPVVQTFHTLGSVRQRHRIAEPTPRPRIRFERLIALRASRVLAGSGDELLELTRMGMPRNRISVVPCGVDLNVFTPYGRAADRTDALHRLVSVGDLVRHKGFDTAIEALAHLPVTELLIASAAAPEPEEERRLYRLATETGVAERVRIVDRLSRPRIAELLRSADVVVCTPRYETFGMAPLEAMACRRPVVATAVGGMADTVVDGVTGRLIPALDPYALARAVRPLLEDATLREVWGAAGHARARTRYCWPRIAGETLGAYRRAAPLTVGELASSAH